MTFNGWFGVKKNRSFFIIAFTFINKIYLCCVGLRFYLVWSTCGCVSVRPEAILCCWLDVKIQEVSHQLLNKQRVFLFVWLVGWLLLLFCFVCLFSPNVFTVSCANSDNENSSLLAYAVRFSQQHTTDAEKFMSLLMRSTAVKGFLCCRNRSPPSVGKSAQFGLLCQVNKQGS